jgi:pyridoxine 5'-phosphate synthase PdxJ
VVTTVFNLEMASTDEMVAIALRLRPHQVTLVPERREEVTTEGGLDLARAPEALAASVARLADAGIRTSLFIDPTAEMVERSRELGAHAIEIHTGSYAHHPGDPATLHAMREASALGATLGLAVHAGHGLTVPNVAPRRRHPGGRGAQHRPRDRESRGLHRPRRRGAGDARRDGRGARRGPRRVGRARGALPTASARATIC